MWPGECVCELIILSIKKFGTVVPVPLVSPVENRLCQFYIASSTTVVGYVPFWILQRRLRRITFTKIGIK